jgi:hypothetical protein
LTDGRISVPTKVNKGWWKSKYSSAGYSKGGDGDEMIYNCRGKLGILSELVDDLTSWKKQHSSLMKYEEGTYHG